MTAALTADRDLFEEPPVATGEPGIRIVDITAVAWVWRTFNLASTATIVLCSTGLASAIWELVSGYRNLDAAVLLVIAVSVAVSGIGIAANWNTFGNVEAGRSIVLAISWALLLVYGLLLAASLLVFFPVLDEQAAAGLSVSVILAFVAAAGLCAMAVMRHVRFRDDGAPGGKVRIELEPGAAVSRPPVDARTRLRAVALSAAGALLIGAGNTVGALLRQPALSFSVMGLGWLAVLRARVQLQPGFRQLVAWDGRPPVLYLRSFVDDERPSYSSRWMRLFVDASTEHRLATHFGRVGPFIAVGSPADDTGYLGAARAAIPDDRWQKVVLQWMEAASLIVLCAGKTRWINWELANILARGYQEKLILLFPRSRRWLPRRRQEDAQARFIRFAEALGRTPWERAVGKLGDARALRAALLDDGGRVTVVRSRGGGRAADHLASVVAHQMLSRRLPKTGAEPLRLLEKFEQTLAEVYDVNQNAPLLSVRDLSVAFTQGGKTTTAVDHISFDIARGETLALVGESGSGKSVSALSVLKLLAYPPASHPSGQILFEGKDLLALPEKALRAIRGNKIAMIFQEPMTSLNPLHTIERQVGEILGIHQGMSDSQARARTLELLHEVGIREPEKRLGAYPHQLSGGQRQRVMIAMALANEPDLLIADEPTTALDVTVQAQILELLGRLKASKGMSMLFITHDLGIVRKIADRVCVMTRGKIVEAGPTAGIFSDPQHEYTRHLLAAEPKGTPPVSDDSASVVMEGRNVRVWFPIKQGFFRTTVGHVKAVDGIDVTVRAGQTLGVVGESGSGKTTLGLALTRLISSSGRIVFNGQDIDELTYARMRPMRRELQVVFQDPYGSLSPRMSVSEIVEEGLAVHEPSLSADARDELVVKALEEVGLDPATRFRYPHEFSGGQRQRIAIARAMVLKPRFVMLDEPTSALDMSVQAQVVDLLRDLQARNNLAYLFISHDLKVVRALANHVIVMRNGVIVEQGPSEQIFRNPRTDYTRALISAAFRIETAPEGVVGQ